MLENSSEIASEVPPRVYFFIFNLDNQLEFISIICKRKIQVYPSETWQGIPSETFEVFSSIKLAWIESQNHPRISVETLPEIPSEFHLEIFLQISRKFSLET